MYFTIIHWIALIVLLSIFILMCVIALRQTNKKLILPMLFSNFLVMTMLVVSSMYIIDKYTKEARLESVTQKRILITESLSLTGKIRNIGKFNISTCKLEVKLVSNAMMGNNISGSSVFKPSTGLDFLFKKKRNEQPTTVIIEQVIAKNLKTRELRNFSVTMKYPPYFEKPFMNYKLYCH